MDAPEGRVWFVGDMDDPWVSAIAEAVPGALCLSCPGELPQAILEASEPPSRLVLHRAILTPRDAERVARFREVHGASRPIVLCVGPHVRYAELERWLGLVDAVLPEATAIDTIARHLETNVTPRPEGSRPRIWVVSENFELRQALSEACAWGGYPAEAVRNWSEAGEWGPAVWDVPVLGADWPQVLAARTRERPVVALFGFADRATVSEAKARGAAACLELPFEVADLVRALDRLSAGNHRSEPAHRVPPPPMASRQAGRVVAGVRREG